MSKVRSDHLMTLCQTAELRKKINVTACFSSVDNMSFFSSLLSVFGKSLPRHVAVHHGVVTHSYCRPPQPEEVMSYSDLANNSDWCT